jgi:hypothetical protein
LLRKEVNNYQLFNEYCVRTSLFSFSFYRSTFNKGKLEESDFKEILSNTIFREALFLASPILYNQIIKWEKGTLLDTQKIERLQIAVLKYATRISSRCTPFGLFASCTTGTFGSETSIRLNTTNEYKRHTRFDTTFLNQLFQELLKNKDIKEEVLFYPNSSIYKIGTHYRYIEYLIENKKRSYSLEGINQSVYIEKVLKSAAQGTNIDVLAATIVDKEITFKEAKSFVEELIDNQVLVSELEISVTGKDYFKNLLNRIIEIPKALNSYKLLVHLQQQLTQLDTVIGNDIAAYESIIAASKELVPKLDAKYLFQTDTFTSFKKNTLNKNIQKQLSKAVVLFNKMTLPSANGNIEQFKRDFLKRFEQSEIPLNLVLDAETGIGFGSKKEDSNDLLDNLSLLGSKKRYERVIWTDIDAIMQKKLVEATQNKKYTIIVTEDDFKEIPTTWNDLPDTFSSMIEVYKNLEEEKIFINNIGGSSATYLLGRFSNGNKKLLDAITKIVEVEEKIHSDKILAEIVHLPEARSGNILQRATFRKYEVPYLGKSNAANEYQIPIEDLLVSVKNDKIILRSKKLAKEVLPRLGNAHNYGYNPLPIYQFLCELQTQKKRSSIGFSWNPIFEKQFFLPRVEFENIIFSKAKWNIQTQNFKKLFHQKNSIKSIDKWQKEHLIPNYVELVDGDNKLAINLKNETSIKMLFSIVKNKKEFLLEEFLFSDNEVVKDKGKESFCNQFVVSLYNQAKLPSKESLSETN